MVGGKRDKQRGGKSARIVQQKGMTGRPSRCGDSREQHNHKHLKGAARALRRRAGAGGCVGPAQSHPTQGLSRTVGVNACLASHKPNQILYRFQSYWRNKWKEDMLGNTPLGLTLGRGEWGFSSRKGTGRAPAERIHPSQAKDRFQCSLCSRTA